MQEICHRSISIGETEPLVHLVANVIATRLAIKLSLSN